MMTHHEPIDYVLSDPADDVDHGLNPVDSTYCGHCGGLGAHNADCLVAAVEDAHRKAVEAAVAAQRVADMWPEKPGKIADRADFIARIAETVPLGLASLHRVLDAQAVK